MKTVQKEECKSEVSKPHQQNKFPSESSANLNDYYDYISKLFTSKTQEPQLRNIPAVSINNCDSVFFLKSMVLQDLFTSAFRRYLECSRQSLLHNLNNKLNEPVVKGKSLAKSDVFGRHPYPERKNTDAMSNETIETDLNNCLGSQSRRRSPIVMDKTLPLSSFYPCSKAR